MHCLRLKHWFKHNGRNATLGLVAEKLIHSWHFVKKYEVDKPCPGNHEHCLGSISYPNFFSRLGSCGLMSVKSTAIKSSNSCSSIWRQLFSVRARFSFWTTIRVRRTRQTVATANNLMSFQTFFCKYSCSGISACEQNFINISKIKAHKSQTKSHACEEVTRMKNLHSKLLNGGTFQQNKESTHHEYTECSYCHL